MLIENPNKKIGFYPQRSPSNWSLSSTLSLFISRYFISKVSNDCLPHAKSKQISILHEADCQLNENVYALLNCHACSFKTTKLTNLKKKKRKTAYRRELQRLRGFCDIFVTWVRLSLWFNYSNFKYRFRLIFSSFQSQIAYELLRRICKVFRSTRQPCSKGYRGLWQKTV